MWRKFHSIFVEHYRLSMTISMPTVQWWIAATEPSSRVRSHNDFSIALESQVESLPILFMPFLAMADRISPFHRATVSMPNSGQLTRYWYRSYHPHKHCAANVVFQIKKQLNRLAFVLCHFVLRVNHGFEYIRFPGESNWHWAHDARMYNRTVLYRFVFAFHVAHVRWLSVNL